MWKNYLTTAWRNLRKQRFYSIINIAGLSIGLASCLLITLFVIDEVTYDNFHEGADRIYRMRVDLKLGENGFDGVVMPAPFAPTAKETYPEIEEVARFRGRGDMMVRTEGDNITNINEDNVIYADRSAFDLFTIPVINGDVSGLDEPNTLAISASCAARHFGEEDPVGKTLILNNDYSYEVVSVYKDLPANSHFHFDLMLSMETLDEAKQPMWVSHNFVTYIKLREGASVTELENKFPDMVETYVGPQIEQFLGQNIEDLKAAGDRIVYFTQPLLDIHLQSGLLGDFEPGGDIAYVYIFSAVAIFLLLIACINFMNLATARSSSRAREVGVRKSLGSFRSQLTSQFLMESLLVTAFSMGFALAIAYVALPYFNEIAGKDLALPWTSVWFVPTILLTLVTVTLAAGFYPALFLSAFNPVEVLKGKLAVGAKSGNLRSALVVFQFATSVVLIVSTLIVFDQLGFVQNRNLGYQKDQVLLLDDTYFLGESTEAFKQQILEFPEVSNASYSSFIPVSGSSRNNNAFWKYGARDQEHTVILQNWSVDRDYVETMEMEIIEGRDFGEEFGTDSISVILNETAVRQFGLEPEPLGMKISGFGSMPDPETGEADIVDYTVVGVVKDFHFESLKDQIAPLGLFMERSTGSLIVKLKPSDIAPVLAKAEAVWEEMAAGFPFSYSFLDERFEAMYENEARVGRIFGTFAGLAIFIACLGLFALATFLAEQKTKEIGVRKALGASNQQILMLLSKDFMRLVLIAIGIAIPVSWYFMNNWLENYHYQTGIGVSTYLIAGGIAVMIALLTVSSQSWRAAHTNPVNSLRSE